MTNKKHIVQEVPASSADFAFYFEGDGIKSDIDWRETKEQKGYYTVTGANNETVTREYIKNPYSCNLFIIGRDRHSTYGINHDAYKDLISAFETCADELADFGTGYQGYSSPGTMFLDYGLITNKHSGKKIKALKELLADDNGATIENIAQMLSIVRGEKWKVQGVSGYSQGDYVNVLYCEGITGNKTAQAYGEVYLSCAKEFCTINIDEDGNEEDICHGYIVADCQAWKDEDYKKLVCEWACIPVEQTELQMIDGQTTHTSYQYRTA